MAFDKSRFVADAAAVHMGARDRPLEALLDALGDNLAVLHAELAELKAACLGLKDRMGALEARTGKPEDAPEPARETGWAVMNKRGSGLYTRVAGFEGCAGGDRVLWFPDKNSAGVLVDALFYGEPVLLYKDTLEEVPGDA